MRWKHDKARYFGVKGQDYKLTYLTYWNTAKGRQFLGIFATKELNSLAEILRASGICGFCRQGFLERLNGNYVPSLSMHDNKPSQEEFLIIAETIVSTKNSKESCAPKNCFTRGVVIASNVTKTLLEMSQINLSAFQHKPEILNIDIRGWKWCVWDSIVIAVLEFSFLTFPDHIWMFLPW